MSAQEGVTFLHSGGAGDVVYSLPFIRQIGGGIVYLKTENINNRRHNLYQALKELLEIQPYIKGVREYAPTPLFSYVPAVRIDCDLDSFRKCELRRLLPTAYFHAHGQKPSPDWARPWLAVDHPSSPGPKRFAIICRTHHYEGTGVDWRKTLDQAVKEHTSAFFVGFPSEHAVFEAETGSTIPALETRNLLEVARFVAAAEAVYCSQNMCVTLAQAMGKPYYLETAPGRACHSVFQSPNEHILNRPD